MDHLAATQFDNKENYTVNNNNNNNNIVKVKTHVNVAKSVADNKRHSVNNDYAILEKREESTSYPHKEEEEESLESNNPILMSCLEYNRQDLQSGRNGVVNNVQWCATSISSINDNKVQANHKLKENVHKMESILLRASARHTSEDNRYQAMREMLNILLATSHGCYKEAIRTLQTYLEEVIKKTKVMEKVNIDSMRTQEEAIYNKCENLFKDKIRSFLREKQVLSTKITELENELMLMREERDQDLTCTKKTIMERLEEYERREHDMTYYRRLIATVYKTNEQITRYNEELESLLRRHRIDLPSLPEPDLFTFTVKSNCNTENNKERVMEATKDDCSSNINNSNDNNAHKEQTTSTRALREQVTDNFIAASKMEMNEARLSLQQQLLHCAFDERSAYKLQVNGLKQENANLQFEVNRLQEEVSALSEYIHEKKYKRTSYLPREDFDRSNKLVNESKERETITENSVNRNDDDNHHHYEENEQNVVMNNKNNYYNNKPMTTIADSNEAILQNNRDVTSLMSDKTDVTNNHSDMKLTNKLLLNQRSHINAVNDSKYSAPLTPRPCNVPFAIHNELGISLQSSTSDMVSELSIVGINLKHQLNSALLRLRQLTTFSEWLTEESLEEIDELANEITVIPTISSNEWEHTPHFLRTHVSPDVNNLGWSAAQTSSLVYQFFIHFNELRRECVTHEDDKMIIPRVHQLSEHRELHLPPLNRFDATREEIEADEEKVPVGYVVTLFINMCLSSMTTKEAKNSPYTAPGTSQLWFINNNATNENFNKNTSVGGCNQKRVMEIEFTRFAYNLWYCTQKYAKTQPLCLLFIDVVTGSLPIAVFTVMEQVVNVIENQVNELDVDKSGYFTYLRLTKMVTKTLNDWDAHSLYAGTLAIAQVFAQNKLSLTSGAVHKRELLRSERVMFANNADKLLLISSSSKSNNANNSIDNSNIAVTRKESAVNQVENCNFTQEKTIKNQSQYNNNNNINNIDELNDNVNDDKILPSEKDSLSSAIKMEQYTTREFSSTLPKYDMINVYTSSIFVRYWRRLVIERVRLIFTFMEQLLAPLIEESEVIFGLYLLPVDIARQKLNHLDGDNEEKAETFVKDTFLSFKLSSSDTRFMHNKFCNNLIASEHSIYQRDVKEDDEQKHEDENAKNIESLRFLDSNVPRLPREYLSLLENKKYVMHAKRTTEKIMLLNLFEHAVKPLARLDWRIHFPFHEMCKVNNDKSREITNNFSSEYESQKIISKEENDLSAEKPRREQKRKQRPEINTKTPYDEINDSTTESVVKKNNFKVRIDKNILKIKPANTKKSKVNEKVSSKKLKNTEETADINECITSLSSSKNSTFKAKISTKEEEVISAEESNNTNTEIAKGNENFTDKPQESRKKETKLPAIKINGVMQKNMLDNTLTCENDNKSSKAANRLNTPNIIPSENGTGKQSTYMYSTKAHECVEWYSFCAELRHTIPVMNEELFSKALNIKKIIS